jgi:hypothetical protein
MHKHQLSVMLAILFAMLLANSTYSEPRKSSQRQGTSALNLDIDMRLDVNNLEMFVYNDGNFAYDNANVLGRTEGLYFPRGTRKTVVYAAGI